MNCHFSIQFHWILLFFLSIFFPDLCGPGDIIFNSEYPLHPPDIIFPAEDEKFQTAMVGDNFQASSHTAWNILRDWNVKDASNLFQLVTKIR